MYAIVDIAGQQFKVEKEQKLFVHRLSGDEESKVNFDDVLLIDNDGKVTLGKPVIDGASVSAKIISHVKGDKVLVFKKKRRKGYKTLNGHRQLFTEIQIEKIVEKGAKKSSAKAEEKPKLEIKAETASSAEKPKIAAKKAVAKKATTKKTTKEDPKK